jgi:uncharacterized protein YkwD
MKTKKLLTSALLFTLLSSPFTALAGTFSDLPDTNRNAPAIEYLTEVGVINGYPDGSFKPDNTVNRVEFLKLVLISSEIPTDVETVTPFPDVNNSEWYAKYVRKAYSEGWIEGYPDGTFKPEQSINKVEALKIIGEVQEWDLPTEITELPFEDTPVTEWFTPYIAYAKDKNFLEETTRNYIPETFFSRGRISELLFRSFITRKSGADEYSYNLISAYPASEYVIEGTYVPITAPTEEPVSLVVDFTPHNFASYEGNFFDGITLESSFPNTFYLNEVYYFNGTISSGNYSQSFVFLSQDGQNNTINYPGKVNGNSFSIPVIFRQTGNFKMGIIPGNSGDSKIVDISVLPSLPSPTNAAQQTRAPSGLNLTYRNQNTTFSWDNEDYELTRLTVYQGSNKAQFLFRQSTEAFDADYADFNSFSDGIASYMLEGADLKSTLPLEISSGWSKPSGRNFTAATHQYSSIDDTISTNNMPEMLSDPVKISFTGSTDVDIFTQAAVIKPDGFVDLIELGTSSTPDTYYGADIIPASGNFSFTYTPETEGTYSMEINGTDGSAVLNSPVYIDNGIPLIPNYFDLYDVNDKVTNFNLQTEINAQLSLINKERTSANLSPVTIDSELNELARMHAEDMVARTYFGHINPEGETPNDRRIELGITTPVGENLAIAPTSEYTHYGLMQSGIHRKNILDPKWTKIGIGVAQNGDYALITTQEFSSDSLTTTDLTIIKNNLLQDINRERTNQGLTEFVTDSALETPAEIWSQKMTDEDFFDFTSPGGELLSNLARIYVPTKAIQALILEASNEETLSEEILNSSETVNPVWQKIGIGIDVDELGLLKTTVLFTTN